MTNSEVPALVTAIDLLRAQGATVKSAVASYAQDHGISSASVQAQYYAYRKAQRPVEPESVASQLRRLASEVEDLENRQTELERILSNKPV